MKVKFSGIDDVAVLASELTQGEVGKVVSVNGSVNSFSGAVGKLIVRGMKTGGEGAVLFGYGAGCNILLAECLHYYRVVRMPKGFTFTLEVE